MSVPGSLWGNYFFRQEGVCVTSKEGFLGCLSLSDAKKGAKIGLFSKKHKIRVLCQKVPILWVMKNDPRSGYFAQSNRIVDDGKQPKIGVYLVGLKTNGKKGNMILI